MSDKKLTPFDFLNAINYTKENILNVDNDKQYNQFMINRGLSYFNDTVIIANEMNKYHMIDNKLHFDFCINTIRKRKRFSKWFKAEESESIEVIKEYYGYSNEKARQVLALLNQNELNELKQKVSKGGRK